MVIIGHAMFNTITAPSDCDIKTPYLMLGNQEVFLKQKIFNKKYVSSSFGEIPNFALLQCFGNKYPQNN